MALSACERPLSQPSHGAPLPTQTFEHIERLSVGVSDVRIFQERQNFELPDDFIVSLRDRAVLYLSKKFEATGNAKGETLQILIEDARVTKSDKESSYSFLRSVGVDSSYIYSLELVLRIEHRDAYGRVLRGEVVRATKRFGISEHDGPAVREQKQFKAVEDLFVILDPEMNRVIRSSLAL